MSSRRNEVPAARPSQALPIRLLQAAGVPRRPRTIGDEFRHSDDVAVPGEGRLAGAVFVAEARAGPSTRRPDDLHAAGRSSVFGPDARVFARERERCAVIINAPDQDCGSPKAADRVRCTECWRRSCTITQFGRPGACAPGRARPARSARPMAGPEPKRERRTRCPSKRSSLHLDPQPPTLPFRRLEEARSRSATIEDAPASCSYSSAAFSDRSAAGTSVS